MAFGVLEKVESGVLRSAWDSDSVTYGPEPRLRWEGRQMAGYSSGFMSKDRIFILYERGKGDAIVMDKEEDDAAAVVVAVGFMPWY